MVKYNGFIMPEWYEIIKKDVMLNEFFFDTGVHRFYPNISTRSLEKGRKVYHGSLVCPIILDGRNNKLLHFGITPIISLWYILEMYYIKKWKKPFGYLYEYLIPNDVELNYKSIDLYKEYDFREQLAYRYNNEQQKLTLGEPALEVLLDVGKLVLNKIYKININSLIQHQHMNIYEWNPVNSIEQKLRKSERRIKQEIGII